LTVAGVHEKMKKMKKEKKNQSTLSVVGRTKDNDFYKKALQYGITGTDRCVVVP
jgi:hypothetical protein